MKFELTTVPAHHILCIRNSIPLAEISTFLKPCYERMEALMTKAGADSAGGRAYTYSISPDDMDIAAAFVIADQDLEAVQQAVAEAQETHGDGSADDVEIISFDEGPAAMAVHHGSYNQLGQSWDGFAQELATQGIKVAEPTFEDYVDRGDGDTSAAVTNLYWYLPN